MVALAVMAFGMLGIAGLQSSLRYNSDVSRHRSESLRIAQEEVERSRAYSIASGGVSGKLGFGDLVTHSAASVAGFTSNALYDRAVTVLNMPPTGLNAASAPTVPHLDYRAMLKSISVDVTWTDRSGTQQAARLSTLLHRSPPELAGSLVIPGSGTAVELVNGRHFSIPPRAIDQLDGTSTYRPPGSTSDVRWIFDNSTGFITQVCSTARGGCNSVTARGLQGFVLFAPGSSSPTSADSENPPGPAFSVVADINLVNPPIGGGTGQVAAPECWTEPPPTLPATQNGLEYACVIFVTSTGKVWTGSVQWGTLPLSTAIADTSSGNYKICRYTTARSNGAVGTGTPPLTNFDQPREYVDLGQSLVNQSFLVIRAGDGSSAFACPDDNTATTLINGRTWHHQPAS